jgi:hypothetical protein
VLLFAAVVVLGSGLGLVVVAKLAHMAMTRLGLEFWSVMFWFGLADTPVDTRSTPHAPSLRVVPAR